ncbi:hypothetical protein FACS1894137_15330 [Spirochaetia bacterium]|nr:hypothetical protein FACS1894137_15330 [Spirochaetia bacterium]
MEQKDVFEVEDHLLLAQGHKITSFLDVHGSEKNVPSDVVAATAAVLATFEGCLAVVDGGNPGPVDYRLLLEARNALKTNLRRLVNSHLRYNDEVTDADMIVMGLLIWKTTRTRKVKPVTHPEGELINDEPGHLKGRFHDEGSAIIGIPDTADSLELSIEYDNAEGSVSVWKDTFHTARPEFSLPSPFCNRKCRAIARWRCDNGGKGIWSNPFEVFVTLMGNMA